jgi:hypothetical protein
MPAGRDRSATYFTCLALAAVIISACSGGGGSATPAPNADPREGISSVRQLTLGQTTTIPVTSTTLPVVMLGNAGTYSASKVSLTNHRLRPLAGPIVAGGPLKTDLAHTGNLHNPDVLIHDGTDVWVGEQASNAIVQIHTPQDTSTSYALLTGHNVGGLVFDASHQLWFSDPAKSTYGYITTAKTVIIEPTLPSPHGSGITGTVLGPNGDIYFGSPGSNEILQVLPSNPAVYNGVSIGASYAPKYGVSYAGYLFFTSNGTLIGHLDKSADSLASVTLIW